uniref:Uncharacterized protein LOC114348476 n=1 Tax=Diabrotica virgifera virgifera TaxID=50390 RepID=A0A6P7GYL9_DIAVI
MVNKRFRNGCLSVKGYPGADVSSDHVPVVGKFRFRFKKVAKKNSNKKCDMRILKDKKTKETVAQILSEKLINMEQTYNAEESLQNICETFNNIREEHLIEKKEMRKSWMNDNILQLMEERRKSKNNKIMYNTIQRQIRTEIRKAKENW